MKKEIIDLMRLQGEIKIKLFHVGMTEKKAHEFSAQILDIILKSDAINKSHVEAYQQLAQSRQTK